MGAAPPGAIAGPGREAAVVDAVCVRCTGWQDYAVQTFSTVAPVSQKSATLRVTRVNP